MTAPLTLAAIGERIACLMKQQDAGREPSDIGLEKLELTELGMTMPPRSLADAAVLCDLAFGGSDGLLASEVDLPEALRVVEQLRRVLAGVGMVVCAAAGLDPDAVAWGDLATDHARRCAGVAE